MTKAERNREYSVAIGADPAMGSSNRKGCGLVALALWHDHRPTLVDRKTIFAPAKLETADRFIWLSTGVANFVRMHGGELVVVEDPTSFKGFKWYERSKQGQAMLGGATAAVMIGAANGRRFVGGDAALRIYGVAVQDWIPNKIHHAIHRRLIEQQNPFLEGATDDECFAAGVLMHWLRTNRARHPHAVLNEQY